MRVYIIGNDGITLCREPPAAANEGEIVVASNQELHAAQLSGKRLLALWNALPGVEKRKRSRRSRRADRSAVVGDRGPARSGPTVRHKVPIEAGCGDRDAAATRGRDRRRSCERYGLAAAHRPGALFGNPEKKLGLTLASAQEERGRVYRIATPEQA